MKARSNFVAIANDIGASDKALDLSEEHYLAAIGLFVLSTCYCDRQRTDGFIPSNAMRRAVAPGIETADVAEELVRVGFLETHPEGWVVSAYLNWQRSAEEIQAAIEQRRAAGARGGKARASKTLDRDIDKIDPSTDKSALPHSDSDALSEPSSDSLEVAADEVRSAAKNKLTREEALRLIEEYGKDRCIVVARQILANPPAGGIKSMPGFMRHQLERGGGESAPTHQGVKHPCFACEGIGTRTVGGETIQCEVCEGEGR